MFLLDRRHPRSPVPQSTRPQDRIHRNPDVHARWMTALDDTCRRLWDLVMSPLVTALTDMNATKPP